MALLKDTMKKPIVLTAPLASFVMMLG